MAMTADEGRERVGEIRAGVNRIMRALCIPGPDWKAVEEAASDCVDLCVGMEAACLAERHRRKRGGDFDSAD